jgi:zinc resistance-associated protein
MWKSVLAGTTALVIAGSSLVYAQQRDGRADPARGQPNVEDMRAFAEARLAALKAGLMLTPEQERNWPAFEQAARDLAKQRLERRNAFASARGDGESRSADPIERMRRRGEMMTETGAALKKFADAMEPLYKSLDDSQKRRFAMFHRSGGRDSGRGGRDGREFRGRESRREFRGRDDAQREYRGRGEEREFWGRDGRREFRGREFGDRESDRRACGRRDFGDREFRGRRFDDREFRGRGFDDREFRGREDGRRDLERGPRRSEFDRFDRDRRDGFERERRGERDGFERDRRRENERDARPERGPREGDSGEQRL